MNHTDRTTDTAASMRETQGFDRHRFLAARSSARMTKGELSRLSGVDRAAIHRWESGECRPLPQSLARVADALNVNPSQLMAEPRPVSECTLPELRDRRSLTQAQLADRAGLTRRVLGRIERGKGTLDDSRSNALARALDVTVEIIHCAHARSIGLEKECPIGLAAPERGISP